MENNIFEQATTTTTTVAQTAGYGKFEQNTNRMTESADARLAFGFKYKAQRIDQNVVGGAFFKSSEGATCTVYFRNGSSANGTSVALNNLPSLAPGVKGPSESNGMACKTANQGNFFFYNKEQKDFTTELRGYSKETQEKTTALETQLNAEENDALKYFTTQLGGPLIKDPVQVNQIYNTISYYIQMGGQSFYFGYLQSAIDAQMKILNRKRAENQKLGKTLSSTEEKLWANYKTLNDAIPESATKNPSGYDADEIKSMFVIKPLTGYPFDNLKPAQGIPLQVYVPRNRVSGAEFGKEGLRQMGVSSETQRYSYNDCIDAFNRLVCYNAPKYGDKRFVEACQSDGPGSDYAENAQSLKGVKSTIASCSNSGAYQVNKKNINAYSERPYVDREYLRMITNDFLSPGGAFNNSSLPCAQVNFSNKEKGQSVDGCYTNESYTFKNNVHKLLTEAKERKKKEILENDIIESKFVGILESIEKPTRKNINQSVNQILSETKRYMSKKYDRDIIQENLGNVYKFITAMVGDEDDIKDMFVKKTLDEILVKKLGMDASDPMTIHIIDEVSSKVDANSIPDMITDCHYLAVQIAEAIPTAYANKLTSDSNNGFLSQFQNVITGKLQDGDTTKKLISMLSGPVCETLNGIQSKMDEKLKGFKQDLFQKD